MIKWVSDEVCELVDFLIFFIFLNLILWINLYSSKVNNLSFKKKTETAIKKSLLTQYYTLVATAQFLLKQNSKECSSVPFCPSLMNPVFKWWTGSPVTLDVCLFLIPAAFHLISRIPHSPDTSPIFVMILVLFLWLLFLSPCAGCSS